jgi:hypothetical protein
MAAPPRKADKRPLADRWRGVASLACAAVTAGCVLVMQFDGLTALPEPIDTYAGLAVTWLPVILPIGGLGLGLYGLARDRRKAAATIGTVLNSLGLILTGFILYILTG